MSPDRTGSRIDHLNLAVPDLAAAVAFYEPVLAAIGITKMLQIPPHATPNQPTAMTGFVLDPHGINLEAVCHHAG